MGHDRAAALSPYDVGPKAMPIVVAAGLALLAVGNGHRPCAATCRPATAWTGAPIILILGGLAALIALIALGGGFMIGDGHPVRDDLGRLRASGLPGGSPIGVVIAVVVYLLFSKLLTLSLPAGPLENLL